MWAATTHRGPGQLACSPVGCCAWENNGALLSPEHIVPGLVRSMGGSRDEAIQRENGQERTSIRVESLHLTTRF
ncbi:hypothetical protein HNQ93_004071 [Hymenobacter luteus]|uniref:Uncharacterized protein n=2 Tax=Hymenobacter TaxID=89966 RepID=A0A7W9WEY1_9BACT|nr:hypothetical protein [Hymenobacter latericoloratus]MBB6061192.1 hypothetical protein [Hymenobacter luteus]